MLKLITAERLLELVLHPVVHCMALHRMVIVGISTAPCGALYGITQEWSLLELVLDPVVRCMALHRSGHCWN